MNVLSGVRFGAEIEAAARSHGLDPRFLAAVAAQETGGPGARSGRNIVGDSGHGHGVFQIDDRWHAFASTAAAMDPSSNADYAAGMLSGLLRRYGGDAKAALSAYNSGSPAASGTLTTWGDGQTLGYADSVLRHYSQLGGDAEGLASELASAQPDAVAGTNALSGLASGLAGGAAGAALPAASPAGSGTLGAAGAGALGSGLMPMASFQVTLPTPEPYPTQFRPYTSIAGLDTNGPQQVDSQMTGLIDGGDVGSSDSSS